MSLAQMLAAYDLATLETLASKGLVRRAAKEVKSSQSTIEAVGADQATVISEGHTISIDSSGPSKAQCSCPASGICRHILTAVILLSEQEAPVVAQDDSGEAVEVEIQLTAIDELSQITQVQLKKFAGADWAEAVLLASSLLASDVKPEIKVQGLNSVVSLDGGQRAVTFIAGLGLKETAVKGPKTRARLLTAACAIILRHSVGIVLDKMDVEASLGEKGLSQSYLLIVKTTLEQSAITVLAGAADIAADKLFDLAVSARVQVAPRLSSQLRSLSKQAIKAKNHAIDFHANEFLVLLARSYALVCALQSSPINTKLTGTLRRDYSISGSLVLCVLGAKHWTMPSGARGVTVYAYSEQTHTWYSSTIARAAGMDLGFDPYTAYDEALWGAYSMSSLVGKSVQIAHPRISSDQQIAQEQSSAVTTNEESLSKSFIDNSSSVVTQWGDLYQRLQQSFGEGLTRGVLPIAQ